MSFQRVLQRTWSGNHLFSVLVELTYRCNLDCFFCYNDLALRGRPLSLAQYCDFFADLRDLQVLNLTLTGGEPLAHPDFLRLGARARELGFVVRIKSNGHSLRGEMARRIRDQIDPFLIEVSLHGATAETHDRQTRVPGSFARLLANVRAARRLGLRLKINATLTAWNEHQAEDMLALADRLQLPLQIDPEVTGRDDGGREPLAITASAAGVQRLFELTAARAARAVAAAAAPAPSPSPSGSAMAGGGALAAPSAMTAPAAAPPPPVEILRQADDGLPAGGTDKHCGAGSSGIAVDPYGNVYPCVQWRRPVGNLHDRSIREIWAGSAGLAEVRALTVAAKQRVDAFGEAGGLLAFCPGNAEALTGDPLQIYPGAVRRMQIAASAREPGQAKKTLLPILR